MHNALRDHSLVVNSDSQHRINEAKYHNNVGRYFGEASQNGAWQMFSPL